MAPRPGTGIDAQTGQIIDGWRHVQQSLDKIFSTRFGERIMREWFGSEVPHLLGELGNERTILAFFGAMVVPIELFEPRFKVRRIIPLEITREGYFAFDLLGDYRPRAHLGDFRVEREVEHRFTING